MWVEGSRDGGLFWRVLWVVGVTECVSGAGVRRVSPSPQKTLPIPPPKSFQFPPTSTTFTTFSLLLRILWYYRHTPTYESCTTTFLYPLLEILHFLYLSRFLCEIRKMCPDIFVSYPQIKIFIFFSIFITPHSVLTFCVPRNLLFNYPLTTEIPFLLT